jgi:predicted Fe-Mo cluster-binding NifX family protein
MKVAISSQDKRRIARGRGWPAAYFLIVDTDSMTFDAVENERRGSAEIRRSMPRLRHRSPAQAVLTGNCGFQARRMLADAGIKLFKASRTGRPSSNSRGRSRSPCSCRISAGRWQTGFGTGIAEPVRKAGRSPRD